MPNVTSPRIRKRVLNTCLARSCLLTWLERPEPAWARIASMALNHMRALSDIQSGARDVNSVPRFAEPAVPATGQLRADQKRCKPRRNSPAGFPSRLQARDIRQLTRAQYSLARQQAGPALW